MAYAATAAADNDTDDVSRRWAVIAGMNLSCPTTASVERSPRDAGNIAAFASPQFNVLLEYYLPQQHFSLVGGYNAETVQWFGSKVDATMQNIVVGARYYPLSKSFALQPYASLMTYTNVAGRHVQHSMSAWNGGNGYERNSTISLPRVSIAPTVGLDCYIFSSLALEFQYGFPPRHRRQGARGYDLRRQPRRIQAALKHAPPQHTDRLEGYVSVPLHCSRRQQSLHAHRNGTRHIRPRRRKETRNEEGTPPDEARTRARFVLI